MRCESCGSRTVTEVFMSLRMCGRCIRRHLRVALDGDCKPVTIVVGKATFGTVREILKRGLGG